MRTLPTGSLIVLTLFVGSSFAQAQSPADGYRKIVGEKQRALVREVVEYLQKNPTAADASEAAEWLIEYAAQSRLEDEVVGILEEFLKRDDLEPAVAAAGRQVLCLGLAKANRVTEAVELFGQQMRSVRPAAASRSLEFAHQLAAQARLSGDFDSSRAVYQRVTEAFPFSPLVSEIAQSRMAKLELAGKPAPPLAGQDFAGKEFDLSQFSGKVVVVDFWATNCPPCIDEMPRMKSLYRDLHDKGLEVLGISFDERQSVAEDYAQQAKLPWRMAMNSTAAGKLSDKFNVVTIPSLFVVDPKGNIAQVDVYGENLRITVERLLAK